MKIPTNAQAERQSRRDRRGRYEEANPCGALCGRKLPLVDYYSDHRCDTPAFSGFELYAICGRCCDQLAKLDDEAALALLRDRRAKLAARKTAQ